MQNWKKLGRIFNANKNHEWMQTHATCPFAYNLKNDLFRIFFSTRSVSGFSHGAWIDINLNDPKNIKNISPHPLIGPDKPGYFGDAGVVPMHIIKKKGKYLMYYSGWTLKKTVPFDFYIGLAISKNLNKFKKFSTTPILDRTPNEPFLIGSPYIMVESGFYKMWYISGDKWSNKKNKQKHFYSIKYAESLEGLSWKRRAVTCIKYQNKFEYAFARPVVLKENNIYKMWYSFRGQKKILSYRTGYAESYDGINWVRKDSLVKLKVSKTGWDSKMICYPFIFDHKGKRYMLYNGNDYGKTGFGLAVLENK
jgi:hypothetical protein